MGIAEILLRKVSPLHGNAKRARSGFDTKPGRLSHIARGLRIAGSGVGADHCRRKRLAIASGLLAVACHCPVAIGDEEGGAPLALASTASSVSARLGFEDAEYPLYPVLRVVRRGGDGPEHLNVTWPVDGQVSRNDWYFARLRLSGQERSDDSLRFKIEAQPDTSSYELCYCPLHETDARCASRGTICHELSVAVTERSGVLYMVAPEDAPWTVFHHLRDFIRQRVELSVSKGDHKVYREILIEPPKGTPECSDYPDDDVDRYVCMYLGETVAPPPAPNAAALAALPGKLVQSKANYELVFAEEFDANTGRPQSGYCEGGLSNLDRDKWNYRENWCERVDAANVPCENLRDGYYEMSSVLDVCNATAQTVGKYSYKYGYLETRYTVDLGESDPQVMNSVIGDPGRALRYAAEKYDVPIRNYEEMSKFLPIEIDLFEYYPERLREQTLWFYNYHPYIHYPHTEPRHISHWTRFCEDSGQGVRQLNFFTVAQCEERDSLTVTKGLEWTPRGYRTLVKVKDLHDDFIVVSKESTPVQRRRARSRRTPTQFANGLTPYRGTERDRFFEFLEPGNPDSVLIQYAIGHMPLNIHFGDWGPRSPPSVSDVATARMKIDYVRVFQPRDRYSRMEPVYE